MYYVSTLARLMKAAEGSLPHESFACVVAQECVANTYSHHLASERNLVETMWHLDSQHMGRLYLTLPQLPHTNWFGKDGRVKYRVLVGSSKVKPPTAYEPRWPLLEPHAHQTQTRGSVHATFQNVPWREFCLAEVRRSCPEETVSLGSRQNSDFDWCCVHYIGMMVCVLLNSTTFGTIYGPAAGRRALTNARNSDASNRLKIRRPAY